MHDVAPPVSRLDALMQVSFDLVLELTPDLTINAACPQVLDHLGREQAAVVGRSLLDLVAPRERERVRAWAEPGVTTTEPRPSLATYLLREDGTQPAYECALRAFADGDAGGAFFVARDRTDVIDTEQRYELIFRQARNGAQVHDVRTGTLECNRAMAAMLGYTVDEYLALPRAERFHPDDLPVVEDDLERALRGEYVPSERTVRMLHRNGSVVVCDAVRSVAYVDGEPRFVLSESRDITEFVGMVEALERSESRYRLLFESVVEGVLITGPDRSFVECNEAFAAMVGYTPEELLRVERVSLVHPDDWPAFKAQVDRLWAREVDRIRYQTRLIHREGHPVYIDGIMQLIIEDGELTGAVASLRDMSTEVAQLAELAEREEQYRRLFELVQHGLALGDVDGGLLLVNRAMGQMLGYDPAEMAGMTWFDITVSSEHEMVDGYVPVNEDGEYVTKHVDGHLVRRDGEVIEAEAVVTPVLVEGVFVGTLAACTDVTEQRRLAREIEQVSARMQRAAIRGEFLAMVSHELRTPLTAIIGFTELLELEVAGPLTGRQAEYLDDIKQAAEQLLELINDLLDLTRMEAGKFEVHPTEMAPVVVVEEAARMFEPLAARKNIHFSVDATRSPGEIRADPRAFRQVLNNLISNAVKFTSTGSVAVSLEQVGDRCVLEVADTGDGIPPEALERVFDPFVQVNMSLDRNYGGSGLGLPICQHLVDLHGGRLQLASEQGAGTTVRAEFPVAGPSSDAA